MKWELMANYQGQIIMYVTLFFEYLEPEFAKVFIVLGAIFSL